VSPRVSKKQIILDSPLRQGLKRVEGAQLRAIRDELRNRLGPGDRTSLGYIASVLREAGHEVQYEDAYSNPEMPEPYRTRLHGVLEFRDLASAEQSLTKLDAIYREYQSALDRVGAGWVQALVKKGKLRARSLAANPRVQAHKRREKQEIASWFQVWLQTPDLLVDWLELRKSSREFRDLFGEPEAEEE
jgi:hypothetical protein